ncbi:MAG: hypothetical protein K6F34_04340 [Lachnospiraceae bacterium]|nr:hypothetical protein [Lachnospiraceae bacterium]
MKKLILMLTAGIVCIGLAACNTEQLDPSVISDVTRTVDEVSDSVEEISGYVGEIRESVQQGIDEANAVMEWYKADAWANNPWISTPVTEDEVEGLIEAGQQEVNSYIGENAVYDVLSADDMEFFNVYFNDESVNGFLLSTYERPEACDVMEVFRRDTGVMEELGREDDKDGYVAKIPEDAVNDALFNTLGISNKDLDQPVRFSGKTGNRALYIDEMLNTVDLVCDGGFYYNDIYVVMMRKVGDDLPFALTVLEKDDNGQVRISMNYWSDDMEDVNWDGSFLYDLYDMMQDSDIRNIMSIPGLGGLDVSLGSSIDIDALADGQNKIKGMIVDAKDGAQTYMQQFDGYEIYYSDLDPSSVEDYVVSQIDVTSGGFTTAEGAGIGTSVSELEEIYGEGIVTRLAGGREQVVYERGKYSMMFFIDKAGEVEEMTIFLTDMAK